MRMQRVQKWFMSFLMVILLFPTIFSPSIVSANNNFSEKVVAKPLVILMEFADYKFSDVENEEWRVRKIPGNEFPTKVEEVLFSEDVYEEGGESYLSVRSFFNQMTNDKYDFQGDVIGPYQSEHNASYYGNNNWPGGDQEGARILIAEAIEAAALDPTVNLSEYDVETRVRDRNTYETKVTYQRSDGQVDTVIVIHPGLGEEFGGGSLGSDAIWPFRRGFTWYGGEYNLEEYVVKDHSGKEWRFDDFAIVAQDSAPDLLIHEFGHILGLPDLYGYGNPPVEWWDIMGGSYTGKDIYGTMPVAYGAYSRLYLNKEFEEGGAPQVRWTNNKTIDFLSIGPDGFETEIHQAHDRTTDKYDTVKIELPNSERVVVEPKSGKNVYFSQKGDNLRNSMTARINLSDYTDAKLTFDTWYKIDPLFDFATVRVNEVGSKDWQTIEGNITTTEVDQWVRGNETEEQQRERNPGHGITGDSDGWVGAEFDLTKFVGQEIELTFYFWTDTNTPEEGIYIDNISVQGKPKQKIVTEKNTTIVDEKENDIIVDEAEESGTAEEQDTATHEKEKNTTIVDENDIIVDESVESVTEEEQDTATHEKEENTMIVDENEKENDIIVDEAEESETTKGKDEATHKKEGNTSIVDETEKATIVDEAVESVAKNVEELKEETNWEIILKDDAEGEPQFTFQGFEISDGKILEEKYYLLEWRNPVPGKVDEGLFHLNPYWPNIHYNPGLIIWHINESYRDEWNRPDQNTANHPGYLFAGVVDADQRPIVYYQNGEKKLDVRSDFLLHDAAFSLRKGEELFHSWGEDFYTIDEHLSMIPFFDDSQDYSNRATNPQAGLILEKLGLKVLVLEENADRSTAKIRIMNKNIKNNPADYSSGLSIQNVVIEDGIISVFAQNDGSQSSLGKHATIVLVGEDENGGSVEFMVDLLKDEKSNVYKGTLKSAENLQVSYVILEDLEGNVRAIYNADLHSGYGISFSSLGIENPDPEKPDIEKPDLEQPDTEQPDLEQPDPEKPDKKKPDPNIPGSEDGKTNTKEKNQVDQDPNTGEKSKGIKVNESGKRLPKTATNMYNILFIGVGLLLIGFTVLFARRKIVN